MSDIVLEQCSKYYPTNPIFIFQHNVRHCIERSYMYVRNSQKNVSQSNPIFNFHDNVKPVVDESPPIWQHRVPIEGWVFYRRRLVVHTQTVVSCVLFRSFLPGPLLFFDWMPVPGSVQLIWAHVISSFIQTIIQPFPNARRQLPSCIPSWLEANIGRVFDPKESSGVQATWHGAMARARTHGQQKYVLLRCKTITTVPCGPREAISNIEQ